MLGRNCRFLQGPDTDRRAVREIRSAIENRVECTVRLLNYTKQGRAFWNLFSLAPVFDADGNVRYFIGVQVDVTLRHALTQRGQGSSTQTNACVFLRDGESSADLEAASKSAANNVLLSTAALQVRRGGTGVFGSCFAPLHFCCAGASGSVESIARGKVQG